MRKVLICGASGFIGRNLFESLSQRSDMDVYGTYLSRRFSKSEKLIKADLTDKEWARTVTQRMDIVINCAAITDGSGAVASNPERYITDNIRINTNVIESAYENKVSNFIFLSCSIVYPWINRNPAKEQDVDLANIHPQYFMGSRLKLFSEDLCLFLSGLSNNRTGFTIIRHSNLYGPHDKFNLDKSHVFAATLTKIMEAREGQTINVWGHDKQSRDFLHISDFVRFIDVLINIKTINYQTINAGSGKLTLIRDVASKINSVSGRNLPIKFDLSKPSIDTSIFLELSKAKSLGWQPEIDIDQGIRQTIDWYLKNKKGE